MAKRLTQEEFENKFYNIFDEDEWRVIGTYKNNVTPIEIQHVPCGNIITRKSINLFSHKTCFCPFCDPAKNTKPIINGINDIASTNPTLFSLLKDKNDGYKYRQNSNQKTWFKCPLCGKEHYKTIDNVNKQGLSCECCSDNVFYPEKYMIELLNQLDLDYKFQYSPKWAKPYRYDFYFEIDNYKYIVETDGGLGHGYGGLTEELAKQSIVNDEAKDRRALENNCILIRIDCNYDQIYHREEYVKEHILLSPLADILDLSCVNFDMCHSRAVSRYCIYIAELWNDGIRGYDNLKKHIPVDRGTLRRYLKEASKAGLILESYEEILNINRKYSNEKLQKSKGTPVMCNETGEIFVSISEAARQYKKYHASNLLGYFSRNDSYCGILPDGTHLTWIKLDNKNVA